MNVIGVNRPDDLPVVYAEPPVHHGRMHYIGVGYTWNGPWAIETSRWRCIGCAATVESIARIPSPEPQRSAEAT